MRNGICVLPVLGLALACTGTVSETSGGEDDPGASGRAGSPRNPSGGSGGAAGRPGEGGRSGEPAACDARPAPVPATVRRLTYREIENSLRDVLGEDASRDVAALPRDLSGPFANDASTLTVSQDQAAAFADLAASVAGKPSWTATVGRFTTCRNQDAACRTQLVRNLGLRLYRRPLEDEQVTRHAALFDVAAKAGDSFDVGAGLVLRAMLQAPQFLYRVERETGGSDGWRTVDGYELASRLSFAIWSSSPDADLLSAAQAGKLATDAGLRDATTRLVEDARSRNGIVDYAADWLQLASVDSLSVDPQKYPGFDGALRTEMKAESLAFFADVWARKAPMSELLAGRQTTASERVAKLQGLDAKTGTSRYDLPADRSGVLSLPAFLAASSHVTAEHPEPSMVMRGLFVLRKVLCLDVPAPPDTVNAAPIVVKPGQTQRTAAEERKGTAMCAGCHGTIDPLAYALEPYDAMGRWRAKDEFGNELRSDGTLAPPIVEEKKAYRQAREMFEALAQAPQTRLCSVRNTLQFALGRTIGDDDACLLESVQSRLPKDASLPDLVAAIVTHPSFRLVRSP